jgi:hypothetical protein
MSSPGYPPYEDPYSRDPGSGSSTMKIVAIIVAIIAGVFLVVCLVCGGLVFLFYYSARSSLEQAQERALEQAERAQRDMEKVRQEWANLDAESGDGKRFAEAFLRAIREQRFADACRETTATFRKQFPSEKELAAFSRAHPALSRPAVLFDEDFAQHGGSRLRYSFTGWEGAGVPPKMTKFTLTVVKEGLNWKVDNLAESPEEFPGMPIPKLD